MTVKRQQTPLKNKLRRVIKDLENAPVAKVGYFHNEKYPSEGGKPAVSVATVAAIHELGDPSRNIPPRPTIRPTTKSQERPIAQLADGALKKVLRGELTVGQVLELIGLKMAGEIRKAISTITSPPLKQSTIAARAARYAKSTQRRKKTEVQKQASAKPLVDTKLLLSRTVSIVEKE